MDNQPQPPQFLLGLSNSQREIIQAHSMDAIASLAGIKFTQDKQLDAMLFHSYQQGRLDLCKALISYDQEQLEAAQQRNHDIQGE